MSHRITTRNYDEEKGSQRAIYACFAWSVVVALHPVKNNTNRESSYPYYSTVLNLTDIMFPKTLNQIKKFENLNNISTNVYNIENKKKIFPLRLTEKKMDKH